MKSFTRQAAALVTVLAVTLCLPLAAQTTVTKPATKPAATPATTPATKPAAKSAATFTTKPAAAEKVSSFGNPGAGGKMLTRDELRTCFKEQDSLAARRALLDAEQKRGESERVVLLAAGETLKADLAALDRTSGDAVDGYNERAKKRDDDVDTFNTRHRKLIADADALKYEQARWTSECGDRRYREDDEIAIRRGQ